MTHYMKPLILGVALSVTLPACTSALIGSAVVATAVTTTAVVAADRRPVDVQYNDRATSNTLQHQINKNFPNASIDLIIYNKKVLLTGEVPTPEMKEQIGLFAQQQAPHITRIYNNIQVGPNASIAQQSKDSWITSKVRTFLTTKTGVPSNSIQIVTRQGVTYLMGLVTVEEANLASVETAQINGIKQVVKVFDEYQEKPRQR